MIMGFNIDNYWEFIHWFKLLGPYLLLFRTYSSDEMIMAKLIKTKAVFQRPVLHQCPQKCQITSVNSNESEESSVTAINLVPSLWCLRPWLGIFNTNWTWFSVNIVFDPIFKCRPTFDHPIFDYCLLIRNFREIVICCCAYMLTVHSSSI